MDATPESITVFTAAVVALVHTVAGPDHYVPFIAMARANGWSVPKALWITALCGLGHLVSSVILGTLAGMAGMAVSNLEGLQDLTGELMAYGLLFFGAGYALWGFWKARQTQGRNRSASLAGTVTPWALFLVFALGPCEPLIAFSFPVGLSGNWMDLVRVGVVFSVVTLLAMLGMVWLGIRGLRMVSLAGMERYVHVLAGVAVFLSGAGMLWLGL